MFKWLALSLCITLIQGADAESESFGRLSRTKGDVYVLKLGAIDWDYGVPNSLIEGGDIIKTGAHDFAEVELENGTLVRMGEVTEVRVRYLHKDSDNLEWMVGIDLLYGVISVRTPELSRWVIDLDVEIPNGSVTIMEESLVKVIVRRSGASRVIAYQGDVLVAGEWDELCLDGGESVWISASGELERPSRIYAVKEDRFDRWCEKYHRVHCESTKYVHTDIYIGVHYLDTYGDWVWLVDCGWTWRPRVRPGWRPYRYGRWTWSVGFGWFWASCEPWGWVPFHYGRWAYSLVYGWVWIPGSVWGPGWVAWSWGSGWVGWTPLGPTDRPVCVDNAHTAISSDHFLSRSKKPVKEAEYSEYVDVKVENAKWSKNQPVCSVGNEEGTPTRNLGLKRRESGGEESRNFKDRDLARHSYPKKKLTETISRPADVSENSDRIRRKEYSTPKRNADSSPGKKEAVSEETRQSSERPVRKAADAHPDNEKPKSVGRNRPKSEQKAVEERTPVVRPDKNGKPNSIRRNVPEGGAEVVKRKPAPSQRRK